MAFPAEFKFANEDDFTQNFIIPLLQRLGFSLVVNYHGSSELGKDLIFAEIDRFGHVRYHGLQAKYEPSISVNEVEGLISDCRQAFNNPFTHPQTGTVERISSFYAMNGGSLGPDAVRNYFNALLPTYGGNALLLQGKDLVTLDRWASARYMESTLAVLTGLRIEIIYNFQVIKMWSACFQKIVSGEPIEYLIDRLRTAASSAYLQKPALAGVLDPVSILVYSEWCEVVNRILSLVSQGILTDVNRLSLTHQGIGRMDKAREQGKMLLETIDDVMKTISPLTAL